MRNIRRDAMDYVKALKKKSEITEDDQKKAEKDLQDLTDKYIKKVDEACASEGKGAYGALSAQNRARFAKGDRDGSLLRRLGPDWKKLQ